MSSENQTLEARPDLEACDALECTVESLEITVFSFPTDGPESDGTLKWDHTTMILVQLQADGRTGLGYTYGHEACAVLIRDLLRPQVIGCPVRDHQRCWEAMVASVRNLGVAGISAMAISAVDLALWDLRAKLLDLPVSQLLGQVRDRVPAYGSGGFTSYDLPRLERQLSGWVEDGFKAVKMKVGRDPAADPKRVEAARLAIGNKANLYIDGNNAYKPRQAIDVAWQMAERAGVTWFEQPVSAEDVSGMRFVREKSPAAMAIADGEYGYTPAWFHARLEAQAADVYMPDPTRCLGLTGFRQIAHVCAAAHVPISSHCAPALMASIGCAMPGLKHCEYFHDHARIESTVFDGAARPDTDGCLRPATDRPGFGLEFKPADAARLVARAE